MSNFEQQRSESAEPDESLEQIAHLVVEWLGPEARDLMRSAAPPTAEELAARRRAAERLFPGR